MIALENVTVVEDGEVLLAPLSMTIRDGEAAFVCGPNGSGKTTLLHVLAGTRRPTSGRVSMTGVNVSNRDSRFRRSVAALIGVPPLARELTVWEHLAMVMATWSQQREHGTGACETILDELDIASVRDRFPHELSSGQTQLFALALILSRPCSVLLLDEPEQRLDAKHVSLLAEVLAKRRAGGTTLVVASHSETLTASIADHRCDLSENR